MDRRRLIGVALVLVSAVAFATGGLFAKPAYAAGLSWLTFLAWRFTIGGGLAWLALLLQPARRAAMRALPRRTVLVAIALGVLYVGNAGAYYAALETVPLSLAAIIVFAYPPIVAVLARWLGRPLEGIRAWGALGLALLGVILAVGSVDPAARIPLHGLLLALGSPLIYAFWIMLSARVGGERRDHAGADTEGAGAQEYGALAITSTAVAFVVLSIATGERIAIGDIPAAAWVPLVGVGVISTFVAILTFYAGARLIGAAQAALISTIEPVITIALAAWILSERLEPVQLLGGATILGAVLLAQTGGRTRGDAEPPLPQPIVRLADD